jgi:cathepsin L
MRAVVAVVCLLALVAAKPMFKESEYQWLFGNWMSQHNKVYTHDQFFHRFQVFKANLDAISSHNAGNASWTQAMNKFGDLTRAEFLKTHTGLKGAKVHKHHAAKKVHLDPVTPFNWNDKGAVTPVKDQGQCGSCWAFSTTGSLEGAWFLKSGKLVSMSEQQLVDCSSSFGNQGCNGGLMDQAFQYVEQKGICTEDSYPYTASGGQCEDSQCTPVFKGGVLKSYQDVSQGDAASLVKLMKKKPVSVAVDATSWQFYSGGVMTQCSFSQLDHGVLAVGVGGDSSNDQYFIVKNSWGEGWGTNGFIFLQYTDDDSAQCGIDQAASAPTF